MNATASTQAPVGDNIFLSGNYAPVKREGTFHTLQVTGCIPEHLDGRYLRIGPNPIEDVDPETYSWFIGDGMVHGVRLRDGRAEWYRNRWVRGPAVSHILGEPSPRTSYRAGTHFTAANTNVLGHAGRTLALVEGGVACQELTDELETAGSWDFLGTVAGGFTAHPKVDPETGEMHAITYRLASDDTVRYVVVGPDGRARRTVEFAVPGKPMLHDMALTENHVLFFDVPLILDPRLAAAISSATKLGRPISRLIPDRIGDRTFPRSLARRVDQLIRRMSSHRLALHWNPDHPTRIGVLNRRGAPDLRWFPIEPCLVFHTLNAYEENGSIVCDAVRIDAGMPAGRFDLHRVADNDEGSARLHRWIIDPSNGTVTESDLDDHHQEFPMVDPRRIGRRHRFGYTSTSSTGQLAFDGLLRHDLTEGTTSSHPLPAGHLGGEFSFVPTNDDGDEGAGILMGYTYDTHGGQSTLLLLDASTMSTLATVHLPVRVPYGFHGNFIPSE